MIIANTSDLITCLLKVKLLIASVFMLLFGHHLMAQTDSTIVSISINGKIREGNDQPISNVIVINKRTKSGFFGKSDGSFNITCNKTDTLTITSLGYISRNICFKDSAQKATFDVVVYLEERISTLNVVEIFAPRDLDQIQKDIESLGYNEQDYMLSGINAVASPITFLYQQFSKVERSKRLVKQMDNEDKKRDLLKELFQHYVDYEIIDLTNEEFDDFIDFLNVSDEFIKSSSQYDFLIFVKDRFTDYKVLRRQKSFKESDYNFEED